MKIEIPAHLAVIVYHSICRRLQDVALSNNYLISEYGLDPDRSVEKMLRQVKGIFEDALERETGKVPENLYP